MASNELATIDKFSVVLTTIIILYLVLLKFTI